MGKIKGMQIVLYDKIKVEESPLGEPIYSETEIVVDDILVSPISNIEVVNQLDLSGKKEVYVLGIPKGDTNKWEDRKVKIFGRIFKTFGSVEEGIEENIPMKWHKKIMVDRYE